MNNEEKLQRNEILMYNKSMTSMNHQKEQLNYSDHLQQSSRSIDFLLPEHFQNQNKMNKIVQIYLQCEGNQNRSINQITTYTNQIRFRFVKVILQQCYLVAYKNFIKLEKKLGQVPTLQFERLLLSLQIQIELLNR